MKENNERITHGFNEYPFLESMISAYINKDSLKITGSIFLIDQIKYAVNRLSNFNLEKLIEEINRIKIEHKYDLDKYYKEELDRGKYIENAIGFLDLTLIIIKDALEKRKEVAGSKESEYPTLEKIMAAYINLDADLITGSNVLSEQVKYSTSRLEVDSLERLHEELVRLKACHEHDLKEYFNENFDFGANIEEPEEFIDMAITVVSDAMQEREVKEQNGKMKSNFALSIVNAFFKDIERLLSKKK